ncbi:homocysteine S-methyltransferase family protein [Marinivivus vitaminiproducens]|uniref:homocysteine S-methyltransferase family protein n=1 Tax=Marinivivus vitaminiproducens TaxID=3035935 RepID=UPI002798A908|nr:homocysteine S-methyltransferase family protein [Geminicoccaceae bacterium SCSIO 64248]
MTRGNIRLPQMQGGLFLTDGGLETTLIFHDGLELPCFAAFDLLRTADGRDRLHRYFTLYARMAVGAGLGFILESPTWRANADWGKRLGYDAGALADANRVAIALMHEVRDASATSTSPMVVSGNIGPRGDGYDPGAIMTPDEAHAYHAAQIGVFAGAGVDMVSAFTMTNVDEAMGVVRAAQDVDLPVVIAFTLETDGRLPTGQALDDAIAAVDQATGNGPAYYMINCAHPSHFRHVLDGEGRWIGRIRGLRANASKRSHAELDSAPDLDDGDPAEFGRDYGAIIRRFPWIKVLGGCCGTDHRHVDAIATCCRAGVGGGAAC